MQRMGASVRTTVAHFRVLDSRIRAPSPLQCCHSERSAKASARGRSPSTSVHHLAFFVLTTFTGYYYNCQTLSGTKKIIPQRCQRIRRSPNAGSIEQHRLHRVSVGGTYPTAAPLRNNFSKVVPDTEKSQK